jgi:hypothetical protein
MRVRHLNDTRQITYSRQNWLVHWEKISGQNAYLCFVKDCINRPTAGGLVQKDSQTDQRWYIVPLCSDCSKKTGQDLDIWDQAALVRADDGKAPQTAAYGRQSTTRRVDGIFLNSSAG